MPNPAAHLEIVVSANTRPAVRGLREVDRQTQRTARVTGQATRAHERHSRALRTVGKASAYALGAGGFGGGLFALFDVTKKSILAFKESERVTRQTAAAIRSTGGVANVTAKHVTALANALAEKTGIDDEAIQTSQNLLLTFTNVRNEAGKGNKIFDQSTKAIVDMATAMNHGATPSTADLHSATLQLGKALQDPIKGAGALRRVGVQLDTQQQKQIKTLVAHGHTLQAQKIILRELTKEFGGSAAKQATAGKRLNVTLGNLAEVIGRAINPFLQQGAARMERFINQMLKGTGQGGRFVDTLRGIWKSAKPLLTVVWRLGTGLARFAGSHTGLATVALEMAAIWAVARKFRGFSLVQAISGGMAGPEGKRVVGGRLTGLLTGLKAVAVRGGWTLLGASILNGLGMALSDRSAKLDAQGKFQNFLSGATVGFIKPAQANFAKMMDQVVAGGVPRMKKHDLLGQLSQLVPGIGPQAASKQFSVGRAAIDESHLNKQSKTIIRKVFDIAQRARHIVGAPVRLRVQEVGIEKVRKAVHNLGVGFGALKRNTAVSTGAIARIVDANFRAIRTSMGIHSKAGRRALERNMTLAANAITDSLRHGWVTADQFLKSIRHSFLVNSRGSARTAKVNFNRAEAAIRDAVNSGRVSADSGLKEINRLFRIYLGKFGLHGASARLYLQSGARGTGFVPGHAGTGPGHHVQRGGFIAVGKESGDSVHAMLEKGEGVINRKAVKMLGGAEAIHAINRAAPRFQSGGVAGYQSGGMIRRQKIGGPDTAVRAIDQKGLDKTRNRADKLLDRAKAKFEAAQATAGGGESSTHGLVPQVLRALAFARKHGWHGQVTSGFRSRSEQAALYARYLAGGNIAAPPGRSNHERGRAVDVTDIPGFAHAMSIAPPNAKLLSLVPGDPVHFSVDGHQRGGMVRRMQRGGIAGLKHARHHRFTIPELRALWVEAGGNFHKATTMAHVAVAESGLGTGHGLPWAHNPSGATGLWQILGGAGDLYDPWVNATNAVAKYKGGGLNPWVSSKSAWGRWAGWYDKRRPALLRGGRGGGRGHRGSTRQTKLPPALPVRHLSARLRRIRRYGALPKDIVNMIAAAGPAAEKYGDYASRAQALTTEGDDTTAAVTGLVFGHDEPYWLRRQLDQLSGLRNLLARAHRLILRARKRIKDVLLKRARRQLRELRKHPVLNRDRIKAYTKRIIPGLKNRYKALGSTDTDLLSQLTDVQGAGGPLRVLRTLPPVGELGGQIFDVQSRLRELGAKTTATAPAETSERLQSVNDLLKQQLQQSNIRTALSESAFKVFQDLPYAGSFQTMPGQARIVPGSRSQAQIATVHGGETIGRPGPVQITLVVEKGAGVDESKIRVIAQDEMGKTIRSQVRRTGRTPGRAGT